MITSIYNGLFLGSGVQDQLDALALPQTPPEMAQQQQASGGVVGGAAGTATPSSGGSGGTGGIGCHQCMGLSQLSFAASTMPPVTTVRGNLSNPLHIIENRNIAHALSDLTDSSAVAGVGPSSVVTQAVQNSFQNGGGHSISMSVGLMGGSVTPHNADVKDENNK